MRSSPATATQSEVEAHETFVRPDTPLGAVRVVHVAPPSDVVMIVLPLTATQSAVEEHETPDRFVPQLWFVHVTPPSDVVPITR
jgi:hypothetical protein